MAVNSLKVDTSNGSIFIKGSDGTGEEIYNTGFIYTKIATGTVSNYDNNGLHMAGAVYLSDYGPFTANHTIAPYENMVRCNPSGGGFTVSLPSTVPSGGGLWFCIIKNVNSSANTITISPNGHNIDGASSNLTITSGFGVVRIFTDGSNYFTW